MTAAHYFLAASSAITAAFLLYLILHNRRLMRSNERLRRIMQRHTETLRAKVRDDAVQRYRRAMR